MNKNLTPIERACLLAGGQTKLAKHLDPPVSSTAVCQWVAFALNPKGENARPIPDYRAVEIHKLTDGQVTYRDLRPDLSSRWDMYELQIGSQP